MIPAISFPWMSFRFFQSQRFFHPSDGQPHSSSVLNIATVDSTLAFMEMGCMGYYTNRQLMDRYSSLDGSDDTFLSCNTHPFPSQVHIYEQKQKQSLTIKLTLQGSLAGLEELAARGTMAANGSMPSVNISVLNTYYVRNGSRRSPDSPATRRVRIAAASRQASSDNDSWADCLEEVESGLGFGEDEPKHRRARLAQVCEEKNREPLPRPSWVEPWSAFSVFVFFQPSLRALGTHNNSNNWRKKRKKGQNQIYLHTCLSCRASPSAACRGSRPLRMTSTLTPIPRLAKWPKRAAVKVPELDAIRAAALLPSPLPAAWPQPLIRASNRWASG